MQKMRMMQSLLGLIFLGVLFLSSLEAREIFDVNYRNASETFNFNGIKTVSFYFLGDDKIDGDKIVKEIAQDKADVKITGEKGVEGKALSPDVSVDVMIQKNEKEKAYLILIDAYVKAEAKQAYDKFKNRFSGRLSIESHVLTFSDSLQFQEIEKAVSDRLQNLANSITSSTQTKPTFFVVH